MAASAWRPWLLGGFLVGGLLATVRYFTSSPRAAAAGTGGPLARTGDRVVLAGDSIAQGLAGPLTATLASLGIGLHALAAKGVTAKGLLPIVKANASVLSGARVVLLSLGSNDAALADPASEAQAVTELASLLRSTGAALAWIRPPNFRLVDAAVPLPATSKKQDAFEAMLAQAIDDRIDPSVAVVAELSPVDRVHLTPKGYALYAHQISADVTGAASA